MALQVGQSMALCEGASFTGRGVLRGGIWIGV